MSQNNWVSYIPFILSLVIFAILLSNLKGSRTYLAISIALVGTVLIALAHQMMIPFQFYNWGTVMLFMAIWLNSNLLSFISHLKNSFTDRMIAWQK